MLAAETFLQLARDPAHIAFELVYECLSGLVVYPVARFAWRRAVKRHDREVHHV